MGGRPDREYGYRVKNVPHKKYVRDILKQLPEGFQIGLILETKDGGARLVNSAHPCVLCPDGTLLRNHKGQPVAVAGTPGSRWAISRDVRGILRAYKESHDRQRDD